MDLEAARNVTAAADAQLEASRRLLESLKNKADGGANASLHSPREGGVGSAASKLSPALGLRLGVPSRGGERSPRRSRGTDAADVRREKPASTPPRAPTSVGARASAESLRELPPAMIKESLDSPQAHVHGDEAGSFASPGAASGEAQGACDLASDDDEEAAPWR